MPYDLVLSHVMYYFICMFDCSHIDLMHSFATDIYYM